MALPKAQFRNLNLPTLSQTGTREAARLLSYISDRQRATILDQARYRGVRELLIFLDLHYELLEGEDTHDRQAPLDTPSRRLGFPGN